MSIILEALKKASINRDTRSAAATVIMSRQEEKAEMRKIESPDGNGFSMSRTMLMAVGAIITVGVVAFMTADKEREARISQQNIRPISKISTPSSATSAATKIETIAEGYAPAEAPAAAAPKQGTTPIGSFIARLSNPHLTLNGIVYGIGKPAAIIENKILEEGASIKGAKVVKIHSDSVEMLDETTGHNFILKVD